MSAGAVAPLRRFDVCNGDADGLCAVRQWRLHEPAPATLVTGLKREIALLQRVPPDAADEVLVCDLSLARNAAALEALLAAGVHVRWFDHHQAGTPPRHGRLELHLDTGPRCCTSLLVDACIGGIGRSWALAGAYGDALTALADRRAAASGFDARARAALRRLGEALNYNAGGEDESDVRIAPRELYARMAGHADALAMARGDPLVDELDAMRREDLRRALAVVPLADEPAARLTLLPDAAWSRRVGGSAAHALAAAHPRQAQAVLVPLRAGGWRVSVRAPRAAPQGADLFCNRYGGAGRAGAAGIDALPEAELPRFAAEFTRAFPVAG